MIQFSSQLLTRATVRIAALIDIFGVFNIYTERTFAALTELSFPFAISSYMLFVLYWHEMMTNSSIVVHPFITKMRIPFFVTAGVLLLLQIVRTILRNITPLDNLSLVTGTSVVFWSFGCNPDFSHCLFARFYQSDCILRDHWWQIIEQTP